MNLFHNTRRSMPSSSSRRAIRGGLDLLLLLIVVAILHHSTTTVLPATQCLFAQAKEIIATHEWQKLGENDTVPAGLHVKIDLSTGDKWAKLPSEYEREDEEKDDDDGNRETSTTSSSSSSSGDGSAGGKAFSSSTAVMDATGALTILDKNNNNNNNNSAAPKNASRSNAKQDDNNNNNNNSNDDTHDDDEAKYLMMHRVISKLPPEELERFGGLPELPALLPPSSPGHHGNNDTAQTEKITAEQRQIFQNRMDELWTQRQLELKQAQETLADFPEMLKVRMATMTQYLEDVEGSLRIVLEERQQQQQRQQQSNAKLLLENDDHDEERENDEKEEADLANDIVSALRDLEYLLSDLDNARDFHTLGGWPILVALLDVQVHRFIPSANTAVSRDLKDGAPEEEEVMALVDEVRALAALCIGTAISNLGEFRSWALEDVSTVMASLYQKRKLEVDAKEDNDGEGAVQKVSVLSLLIASFEKELSVRSQLMGVGSMAIPNVSSATAAAASIKQSWSKARYQSHATYKLRAIYALGALLRGNPPAQHYFALHHGPEAVVRDALGTLSSVRGPSALADGSLTKLDYKFASKVLALGEDIIMDVLLHGDNYDTADPSTTHHTDQVLSTTNSSSPRPSNDEESVIVQLTANQLVAAFATERWCDLSLRMLFPPFDVLGRTSGIGIQEKAMRSVGAMAPACSSHHEQYSDMIDTNSKTKTTWGLEEVKRVRSEWNKEGSDDGLDSRYRRELLELADGVMEVLLQG